MATVWDSMPDLPTPLKRVQQAIVLQTSGSKICSNAEQMNTASGQRHEAFRAPLYIQVLRALWLLDGQLGVPNHYDASPDDPHAQQARTPYRAKAGTWRTLNHIPHVSKDLPAYCNPERIPFCQPNWPLAVPTLKRSCVGYVGLH